MTKRTTVHSSWITQIDWASGTDVLQGIGEIKLPCIWVLEPAKISAHFGEHIFDMLSETEKLKGSRFHQAAHRERYKTTHVMVRILLAQLLGLNPKDIAFTQGHHHKPLLSTNPLPIHFNISYTTERSLIAIDADYPVGVDIEWINSAFDYQNMLEACFSQHEITYIHLGTENHPARFFTLWTRKEAILKLTGEGIGEHLPSFEVLDGDIEATKQALGGAPPDHIHIHTFAVEEDYIGSVATERPDTAINFYRF